MQDELARALAQLGKALLASEIKGHPGKEEYQEPNKAFLYFLERMFYRGRPDSLSKRYFDEVRPNVKDFLGQHGWSQTPSKETDELGLRKLPQKDQRLRKLPQNDQEMVYGAWAAVSRMPENNVMKLAKDAIEGGSVQAAYTDITGIKHIGDKLTCMFLRDVAYLYDLCDKIANGDVKYFLPVDTWVIKGCHKLGVIPEKKAPSAEFNAKVKSSMVEACAKIPGVSPIDFDHGLWGMSQLQYVLQNLDFVEQNLPALRTISESALFRSAPAGVGSHLL